MNNLTSLFWDNTPLQISLGNSLSSWWWVALTLYLILALLAFARGAVAKRVTYPLVVYLLLSAAWMTSQLIFSSPLADRLQIYGLLFNIVGFVFLTDIFLQDQRVHRNWWVGGLSSIFIFVLLDIGIIPLPETIPLFGDAPNAVRFAALLGCSSLIAGAISITAKTYQQLKQRPFHRNRLNYWTVILIFITFGTLLILSGRMLSGTLLFLPASLLATYAMLIDDPVGLRRVMRKALTMVLGISFAGIIYVNLLNFLQGLLIRRLSQIGLSPAANFLFTATAATLIVVVLFQPMLNLIRKAVFYITSGSTYDPGKIVREYSGSISNIVDLEKLEARAVQLISEGMEVRHGTLYLVDKVEDPDFGPSYSWKSLQGYTEFPLELGVLPIDSVVALHLSQLHQPLTQFEIDLLPKFAEMPEEERSWFSSLGFDVYVPIHAQDEWIGLMALGSKVSGDRYYNNDLELLITLADQTAVALKNARLVADLITLNKDLKQTYEDLEKATQQLQEMDKLKSAFIGVITHELRTPFSNIGFALQFIERYGLNHLLPEQREELVNLNKHVKTAKSMVDGLVTFASFLSKQGELRPTWISFSDVVEGSLLPLRRLADSKRVQLAIDLNQQLPQIHGDPERLMDAIHHLVHNAIKFTPESGIIQIKAWQEGAYLHFAVKDNGIGIPVDKLPELWEGFSQMADPLRRGAEGLGLGLALVKFVVHAHNGEIWADSVEQIGSEFGFKLPL